MENPKMVLYSDMKREFIQDCSRWKEFIRAYRPNTTSKELQRVYNSIYTLPVPIRYNEIRDTLIKVTKCLSSLESDDLFETPAVICFKDYPSEVNFLYQILQGTTKDELTLEKVKNV